MTDLGFKAFDADNHYYEAEDAFIRHIDPKMAKRAMQWAVVDGKKRLLVGGRVNRFIPNPTFDPVAKPGVLDQYFRAKESASDMRQAFGDLEPISAAYRDRGVRLELMDAQGIEGCFMFPTLGVGMESSLEHDVPAMLAAFSAFNRWLDDDWGFAHQNRIYSAPYITLADPDWALDELQWAIDHDVRAVNIRASSVVDGSGGRRALGDPAHDKFWKALDASGVTLAIHSGDAGYSFMYEHWNLPTEFESFRYDPLKSLLTFSPISDALASLIGQGVLTQYRNIRVATIETGSEWVGPLLKKMKKVYGQNAHAFPESPIDTFRRAVWVSPYYEDDLPELARMIGADHMLFGSDFPHAEGLADPVAFVDDLTGFDEAEVKAIMRDNGLALVSRAA